jgi:hypothetical protein
MSIRLNTGKSLEYYKGIFEASPVKLKHHISVRLRGMVETVIQASKVAFHQIAALFNKVRRNPENKNFHLDESSHRRFTLEIVAKIVRHPGKTLRDDVDDAVINDFDASSGKFERV